MGVPYIDGYKPLRNYQKYLLPERVLDSFIQSREIAQLLEEKELLEPVVPSVDDILGIEEEPPKAADAKNLDLVYERAPVHPRVLFDYIATDASNTRLGRAGELDVRSFELNGNDRLIETKTTKYAKKTPFFVTQNEIRKSREYSPRYWLYRVHEYRKSPRLYFLSGAIGKRFVLKPHSHITTGVA